MSSNKGISILLCVLDRPLKCRMRLGAKFPKGRSAAMSCWTLHELSFVMTRVGCGDRRVFFLECNENSDHLLIVLPQGGLCFSVWWLVAADVDYCCSLHWRAILKAVRLRYWRVAAIFLAISFALGHASVDALFPCGGFAVVLAMLRFVFYCQFGVFRSCVSILLFHSSSLILCKPKLRNVWGNEDSFTVCLSRLTNMHSTFECFIWYNALK